MNLSKIALSLAFVGTALASVKETGSCLSLGVAHEFNAIIFGDYKDSKIPFLRMTNCRCSHERYGRPPGRRR